jgi:phage shock protein PspC (stress-responsive transcriptional regulator)
MASSGSVIARDDTLLGVCFALGQDFGFNPLYLRILFAVALLFKLPEAIAAYVGLGVLVAFSRWLVPDPRPVEAAGSESDDEAHSPSEDLPIAA